jgi:large subunit ribosomal protein L2
MKKFYKPLVSGKIKSKGGRNNKGSIAVRRRGGGHKKLYRHIDFKFNNFCGKILNIEYDPFRTAFIARVLDFNSKKLSYVLLTNGLKVGDIIYSSNSSKGYPLKDGNRFPILDIPLGYLISNVELKPKKGGQLCRSAGTFCKLLQKDLNSGLARLKLPSKEERLVSLNCFATIGPISDPFISSKNLKKAGRSRWKGIRPHVRGVAMNPVDHPHGGGEGKTSGGRPSVTPWGRITKGQPTRKNKRKSFIIKSKRQF